MTTEAIKLADILEKKWFRWKDTPTNELKAAAELRRLDALNKELVKALAGVMYWNVKTPEWVEAEAALAKVGEKS